MIPQFYTDGQQVHIGEPTGMFTMCGDALEGDPPIDLPNCRPVSPQTVTCERCLEHIEYCERAAFIVRAGKIKKLAQRKENHGK